MIAFCRRIVRYSGRFAMPLLCSVLMFSILCGCDYARMKDDEARQTYETQFPEMPTKAIPVSGGLQVLRETDPETLKNPLPFNEATVERGRVAYFRYCAQCHGKKADGNGTVGQSFAPLPSNLASAEVQEHSDGLLFVRLSLGFKRQPPLAATVAEEDRWAVIHYIRSLAGGSKG